MNLLACLGELQQQLLAERHLELFLDFDGTLAPIVDHPGDAKLPEATRTVLRRIARNPAFTTSFVSGRALADLRVRVGLDHVIYAGNHGLEIAGRGLLFVEPQAAQSQQELRQITTTLCSELGTVDGAEVENKGLTASVHYRCVAPALWPLIASVVDATVGNEHPNFHLKHGKMVFEVRPRVSWNKGEAVKWIRSMLGERGTLAVCLGDDTTDEDAFLALPQGITARVGEPVPTAARYRLRDTGEVQQFLEWLAQVKGEHLESGC